MDLELDLLSETKDKAAITCVVARVSVQALCSQPVDHEDSSKHLALSEVTGMILLLLYYHTISSLELNCCFWVFTQINIF